MVSELEHDWTTQPRTHRRALKRLNERVAEHLRRALVARPGKPGETIDA